MANKNSTYELAFKLAGKVEKSFNNATNTAVSKLQKVGSVAGKVAKATLAMATVAASAMIAVGKKTYDLAKGFDDAYDKIRIGTGATGEVLEGLKGTMKNVFASLPTTLDKASTAIANYNTLLDINGETLETLSRQAIQVEALLGDGLEEVIEASSHAFKAWDIAAEDMSGKMDYIFKVSQKTGVGFSSIAESLKTYASQLQELGYDFDTAAALIGNIEKQGYDATVILNGMKKATANLSKAGVDAAEGMAIYYEAIRMATDETEAIAMATEIFGSQAATAMAYAIRDGTLAVDDLTASLRENEETIIGLSEETWDFAERWKIMMNRLAVDLEPTAMEFFEGLNDMLPDIEDMIRELAPVLVSLLTSVTRNTTNLLKNLGPGLQKIVSIIAKIADDSTDALMPLLEMLGSETLPLILETIAETLPIFTPLVKCLTPILKIVNKIIQVVTPFISGVMSILVTILEALAPILDAIFEILSPILDLVGAFSPVLELVNALLQPIAKLLQDVLAPILRSLTPIIQLVAGTMTDELGGCLSIVGEIVNYFVEGPLGGMINYLSYIIEFISSVFKGDWDKAWKALGNMPISILNGIIGAFESMINRVISAVNSFTGGLSKLWTWTGLGRIPEIPKVSFGRIPTLAEGGITTGATIAEIGEGSEQEAVIPLSKLHDVMVGKGYGDVYNNGGDTDNSVSSEATFNPQFVFNINGSDLSPEEIQAIVTEAVERWWELKQRTERRVAF